MVSAGVSSSPHGGCCTYSRDNRHGLKWGVSLWGWEFRFEQPCSQPSSFGTHPTRLPFWNAMQAVPCRLQCRSGPGCVSHSQDVKRLKPLQESTNQWKLPSRKSQFGQECSQQGTSDALLHFLRLAPDQLASLKVSSHTSSSFPSIDQVQTAVSLLIVTLANQNTCRPTIITTTTKYIV